MAKWDETVGELKKLAELLVADVHSLRAIATDYERIASEIQDVPAARDECVLAMRAVQDAIDSCEEAVGYTEDTIAILDAWEPPKPQPVLKSPAWRVQFHGATPVDWIEFRLSNHEASQLGLLDGPVEWVLSDGMAGPAHLSITSGEGLHSDAVFVALIGGTAGSPVSGYIRRAEVERLTPMMIHPNVRMDSMVIAVLDGPCVPGKVSEPLVGAAEALWDQEFGLDGGDIRLLLRCRAFHTDPVVQVNITVDAEKAQGPRKITLRWPCGCNIYSEGAEWFGSELTLVVDAPAVTSVEARAAFHGKMDDPLTTAVLASAANPPADVTRIL